MKKEVMAQHLGCLVRFSALLVAFTAAPAFAQLLLAGGSLPICSSMNPTACQGPVSWQDKALDAHRYQVKDEDIQRWLASFDNKDDRSDLQAWVKLLESVARQDLEPMPRPEFSRLLRAARIEPVGDSTHSPSLSGEMLYQRLDDRSWWRLLDHFQLAPHHLGEQVSLKDSRSGSAVEVFERFVAMAREVSGRERPRIAISTASSRDPYDALDFYFQVFEQAGAEVFWLQLDRAFTAARAAGRCNDLAEFQAELLGTWDRSRVYPSIFQSQRAICAEPEATMRLTEGVDGLFLNGGDQWLTLHAFIDEQGLATPEWQRIMERLQAGELVLGGTSAGAAVQSGPVMISNGSSQRGLLDGARERPPPQSGCDRADNCPPGLAVDSLTYRRGGLGSFTTGIVDTHFSERWRQFRLLQLMVDTGVTLGLGVDETSAVEVRGLFDEQSLTLRAHGLSGGWLILTDAARTPGRLPLQIDRIMLHHLAPGVVLSLDIAADSNSAAQDAVGTLNLADRAGCLELRQHDSFAELALPDFDPAEDAQTCLLLPLGDAVRARSLLTATPPPLTASGPLRSWRWSLEVLPQGP